MANKIRSETGAEFFARLTARPSLSNLDSKLFPDDPQPGHVIQISGNSGTGKSFLLLRLLTKCLLPKKFQEIEIGGLDVGVILIDTEHNLSVLKLVSLMEQFLLDSVQQHEGNSSVNVSNHQITSNSEEIIKEALGRLVILKTYSSLQLLMNFHSLDKILFSNTKISLLMIDSLTSYFWQDTVSGKKFKKMDLYLKNLVQNLQKCIASHKIVTIFTKQGYFQSKLSNIDLSEITHKIDLKRSGTNLFEAIIHSNQSTLQYAISEKGFHWVIN